MSKYASYVETKGALEELQRKMAQLESDEAVQKVLGFEAKLNEFMKQHNVTKAEVLQIWGVGESSIATDDKRRSSRPMKTFRNPNTGQVVKTKGGNHKVLKEWRKEFDKETIDSWLI
jgi:hypothetical protein